MFQHETLKLILKLIEKQNDKKMSQIFYEKRCRCKEEFLITRKRKISPPSEGKPLQYPESGQALVKMFQIQYKYKLSSKAQLVLNTFDNKYIYYAIDDILYSFDSSSTEKDNLLKLLYSTVLALHNNLSINFFDIWIQKVSIKEVPKINKFLQKNVNSSLSSTYITFQLFYKPKMSIKKKDFLW